MKIKANEIMNVKVKNKQAYPCLFFPAVYGFESYRFYVNWVGKSNLRSFTNFFPQFTILNCIDFRLKDWEKATEYLSNFLSEFTVLN